MTSKGPPSPPARFYNETALQRFCIKLAKYYGIGAWGFKSPGNAGVPDVILMFPGGQVVFVEFKHPNGKGVLSELQLSKAREISALGGVIYVCYQLEVFRGIIANHLKGGLNG